MFVRLPRESGKCRVVMLQLLKLTTVGVVHEVESVGTGRDHTQDRIACIVLEYQVKVEFGDVPLICFLVCHHEQTVYGREGVLVLLSDEIVGLGCSEYFALVLLGG